MKITSYRLVGTLIAVIGGIVAAALHAGVANSLLFALVLEVITLQVSSDEDRHRHNEQLVSAVGLAGEISDSGERRELLRSLVRDLSTIATNGHKLFARQAQDRLIAFVDEIGRMSGGLMTITDAREIQMEGIWALEHLGVSLFATSVVSMDTFWTESQGPDYHHKNLEIVERGRSITRVFILDSSDALKDARLRALLQEQSDAGVDVWYVAASKLPSDAVIDFGIWDDEMVCTLRPSISAPGNVLDATYDTTPAGKQRARSLRQLILHAADRLTIDPAAVQDSPSVSADDLLLQSALLMRATAREQCVGGYIDPSSCRWYHEAWQYLRLLRLVETPRLHEQFFKNYIAKYLETATRANILLCGLADYEMCAVVLDALGTTHSTGHRITALDVCDTPLRNTEWYAQQRHTRVVTRRADATDTGLAAASFQLVVTDAFLTKLPREKREAVVTEWRRILVDGGQVLTTVKIGTHGNDPIKADARQVTEYSQRAVDGVRRLPSDGRIDAHEVESLAHEYAERNVSYPIEADEEVHALFSGFDVSVLDVTPVTEYAVSYYGQVVAVKLAS
jgi:hypothetical protein